MESSGVDWVLLSPALNSNVEALKSNVMVFGVGASGRWLSLEEVLKVGPKEEISVLLESGREITCSLLSLLSTMRLRLSANQEEVFCHVRNPLVTWSQALKPPELQVSVCHFSCPIYDILLLPTKLTKQSVSKELSPSLYLFKLNLLTKFNSLEE